MKKETIIVGDLTYKVSFEVGSYLGVEVEQNGEKIMVYGRSKNSLETKNEFKATLKQMLSKHYEGEQLNKKYKSIKKEIKKFIILVDFDIIF